MNLQHKTKQNSTNYVTFYNACPPTSCALSKGKRKEIVTEHLKVGISTKGQNRTATNVFLD